MRRPLEWVRLAIAAALCGWLLLDGRPAAAYELGDGLVEIHGFYQMEFRGIADSFELTNFNPHQWAHTLNLEAEIDLLPDGWGPISLMQAFIRVEGRYDCVWQSLCHIATGQKLWGDQANRAPGQFANGKSSGHSGRFPNPGSPSRDVHGNGARLVTIVEIPPIDQLLGIGGDATELAVARTLAPIQERLFAVRHTQGSVAPAALPLGPWVPKDVKANGALRTVSTSVVTLGGPATIPIPLPMRPDQGSLFSPSPRLRELIGGFDDLDVNFPEEQLEWNRGASQQQVKELRELYLDIELLDGKLFLRAGRQTNVWGKTELFRAQDQFNPQDIALATLSSLESSRVALWSLRAIWSFWDVGFLQDVRLEFATNLDHYEPTDLGTCGEPYTVWLVCLKKAGAFSHGVLGFGLAGEERPENPWDDSRGLEAGLRLEFRAGRFSFAITDFYGFPDFPIVDTFNEYERNVDPLTGRPRVAGATGLGTCLTGTERDCLTVGNAGAFSSGNRQLFDVICSATSGLAAAPFEDLTPPPFQSDCLLDLFNTQDELNLGIILPVLDLIALALGGGTDWTLVGSLLVTGIGGNPATDFVPAIPLHGGSADGPGYFVESATCGTGLTDEQEALLGTGQFYHPDLDSTMDDICRERGLDLYHAEASVLLEAFPQFDGPVAVRFAQGRLVQIPGARGPFLPNGDPNPDYDPLVDGCVQDVAFDGGECDGMAAILDPRTGLPFRAETTVLSYNFMALLASLSPALPNPRGCTPGIATDPTEDQIELLRCSLVAGIFALAGARRPEISAGGNGRFGRRDFLWHGGGEARMLYKRRNVLGFSMDFAWDRTKTNWGMELVWFEDDFYSNTHEKDGWSRHDTVSLTVSMDRPTFVNFLNANRTIFFNAQFFVRYIDGYTDKALAPDGPFSLLATLTAFTGFWQDRLNVVLTLIHELESNSGGLITSMSYRMTENFSVSTGLTTFRGEPRSARMSRVPVGLSSTAGNDYESRTRFNGLSAVADREELFVNVRYTF